MSCYRGYFHSFYEWACPVIKNAGYIFRKTFSAEYLKIQRQRLYFGCVLWCSWEIQKKRFTLKTAGTRTWKTSKLTCLYGCVASAQSMSLFVVFLLGFKQLESQIIYELNNEGLYAPLMVQIQATVSWMVPWWLKECEVQCGGTCLPVLAVMNAFNWSLNIPPELSSNCSLLISLKADMSLHRTQIIPVQNQNL